MLLQDLDEILMHWVFESVVVPVRNTLEFHKNCMSYAILVRRKISGSSDLGTMHVGMIRVLGGRGKIEVRELVGTQEVPAGLSKVLEWE